MRPLYSIFLACCFGIFISCDKHQKRETKYPNGQVQEQFSVLETENGSFVKDGEYKTWNIDGQPQSTGSYKNGKGEGNWKYWYDNGQPKQDCNMKNDSLDGDFLSWFPTGQKEMEGKYTMGKPEGPWLGWYKNGQMEYKRNYNAQGGPDGLQTEWHENGQKVLEETYAAGVREGAMKFWDTKGKLYGFRTFQKGVDASLPALYKSKKGTKLELSPDGTYKYTYQVYSFWSSPSWQTKSGKFEVSKGLLNLRGLDKYGLIKYTEDSIEFGSAYSRNTTLLVRQPVQQDAK